MNSLPKLSAYALVVIAGLVAGCGSDSSAPTTPARSAATDGAAYRDAVNTIFNRVVDARGAYEDAHGRANVRQAGRNFELATQKALGELGALRPPASAHSLQSRATAPVLHAKLVARLTKLKTRLHDSLVAKPFNTARLGDAVRELTPADRIVTDINTLP